MDWEDEIRPGMARVKDRLRKNYSTEEIDSVGIHPVKHATPSLDRRETSIDCPPVVNSHSGNLNVDSSDKNFEDNLYREMEKVILENRQNTK